MILIEIMGIPLVFKMLNRGLLHWSIGDGYKQLLDEVFVISRIIKVGVRVIS